VFARVWFKTQDAQITLQFAEAVGRFSEAMECYLTTREHDAVARIVTADHFTHIPSALNMKTDVPMGTLKRIYELPLTT